MEIVFITGIVVGAILIIIGFAGCILPVLPGPPIAYLAFIVLKIINPETFSSDFLIIMAAITIIVLGLDYVLPIFGAKLYKASKQGIWFSVIGMLIGIFFFAPFGMIFGLLLGAIIGELASGKAKREALKVGFVSFVFSLLAVALKLSLVAVIAFYFIKAVIEYYI